MGAYALDGVPGFALICAAATAGGLLCALPRIRLAAFAAGAGGVLAGSFVTALIGKNAVEPNELGLLGSLLTAIVVLVVQATATVPASLALAVADARRAT